MQQRALHVWELFSDRDKFFKCQRPKRLAIEESTRARLAKQVATIGHFDEDYPRIKFSNRTALTSLWQAVGLRQKDLFWKNWHRLSVDLHDPRRGEAGQR